MYIYKTTNIVNNKVYIGKSEKSFNPNYLGSGILLNRAIKKYSRASFTLEIIETCDTIDKLNEREKYWISFYLKQGASYNLAEGGTGGNTTRYYSNDQKDVFKKNLSKALLGRKVKQSTRDKLSRSNKGKFYGDKLVLSNSLKKVWQDPTSIFNSIEYRKKLSNSLIGRIVSEDTRNKISKANSGKNNGMSIKIKVDNIIYETRRECARFYNISETAVTKRCKSKNFTNWKII